MTPAHDLRAALVRHIDDTGFGAHGLHVRVGDDVAEHRWTPDGREEIHSVAKAVCVLGAGIAAADGLLDLTDGVPHRNHRIGCRRLGPQKAGSHARAHEGRERSAVLLDRDVPRSRRSEPASDACRVVASEGDHLPPATLTQVGAKLQSRIVCSVVLHR